ncbi:hypothetical protein [Corallococcus sp. AB038B]|uniref:hypothetical protein n=1 Tax=Corallococcus sp. AB038B TaxID=2316718 RepID=UPI000EBB25D6|nr:hypothetical protein [Corallococcus sp. AB038B]RKH92794.1 hypothetical protein D7Y04_42380 [Corallococcus sp. AB038B]
MPRVVELLLANQQRGWKKGTRTRKFDVMTPNRYMHALELLESGADPFAVDIAVKLINASGWLQKPALEITKEDLSHLFDERPWEKHQKPPPTTADLPDDYEPPREPHPLSVSPPDEALPQEDDDLDDDEWP